MIFKNKEDIVKEQKYLIGIEPVIDMKYFVLLLFTDLALKSSNENKAILPLEYLNIIEKIMYDGSKWNSKFSQLIDITAYCEYQDNWEMKIGEMINKVLKEEKLNYNINFKLNNIEIEFTIEKINSIRKLFDNDTLQIMDLFSYTFISCILDNRRIQDVKYKVYNRNLNRLEYFS